MRCIDGLCGDEACYYCGRKRTPTKYEDEYGDERREEPVGGLVLCRQCAAEHGRSSEWDAFHYGTNRRCNACDRDGLCAMMPNAEAQSGAVATSLKPVVRCLICQKPMPDYEPMFCCSGHECGCMGLPTNMQVCSQRCMIACIDGIGKTMEQRRIDAGIELHTANNSLDRHQPNKEGAE